MSPEIQNSWRPNHDQNNEVSIGGWCGSSWRQPGVDYFSFAPAPAVRCSAPVSFYRHAPRFGGRHDISNHERRARHGLLCSIVPSGEVEWTMDRFTVALRSRNQHGTKPNEHVHGRDSVKRLALESARDLDLPADKTRGMESQGGKFSASAESGRCAWEPYRLLAGDHAVTTRPNNTVQRIAAPRSGCKRRVLPPSLSSGR